MINGGTPSITLRRSHNISHLGHNMSRGPWIDHFGDNFLWSNATLILKGMAPYGVVALEEIDRVCERLRPRWGQDSAWQKEWRWMGRMVEERAEAALAEGHKLTAANYF